MRSSLLGRLFRASLLGLTPLSCSGETLSPVESDLSLYEASSSPLYRQESGRAYWPTNVFNYCFEALDNNSPAPNSEAWNDTVNVIEDAILKWESARGTSLQFAGGDACTDSEPDYTVRFRISGGGHADAPNIDAVTHSVNFGLGYWLPEAGILHEIGHVIGFEHEKNREDSTMSYFAQHAGSCSAATNYIMMRPSDPNLPDCVTKSPSGEDRGDEPLTVFDPYSTMMATYCHCRPNLSAVDEAGIAFLYPSSSPKVYVPFSFRVNGGRVTGAEVLQTEFERAGVHPEWFEGAEWTVKVGDNTTTQLGNLLSLTSYGPSTWFQAKVSFDGPFGDGRVTTNETLRRHKGLATALLTGI